jgi:putative MATE family efflux protein
LSAVSAAVPSPSKTNPLLTGAILPTLLRLSVPNVLAMSVSVLVGIAETWYVGQLGTISLAAMALVFPFAMLTQMMSNGAMGGGVSSAVSRALGASDVERARTLALHALVIGLIAGVVYALIFIFFGPVFYEWLGGRGAVLAEATQFSNVLFLGAVGIWVMNALTSVVRGTGNMRVPSILVLVSSLVQIVIGGALGLGIGPVPRLGLAGVAVGTIVAYGGGAAFLLWYLVTGQGRLTMKLKGVKLQWPLFADILKVGALACLSPLQSVLAVLVVTGLVARLGIVPLAGYGIGQRLEFLLIPIAFGIGVAAVPMVGMAMGAGNIARARKVAWTAGLVSAFNLAVMGAIVTSFPQLWAGLFTGDPAVLDAAHQYLRWAGPAFGFFGFGLTLYFASQGSGKVLGPVLASTLRLILVLAVGAWLASWVKEPWPYFALVGAAMVVYGISTALAIRFTSWEKPVSPKTIDSTTNEPKTTVPKL